MIRAALFVLASLMLAACSSDVDRAKAMLEDSLVITTDLAFEQVTAYPGGVVCGTYSAYEAHGEAPLRNQPFIVRGEQLDKRPIDQDWQFFCNDDQAAALHQLSGIGPFSGENEELMAITRQMTVLTQALEAYYEDNFYYPDAEQGLQALLQKPTGGRSLVRYREGGYLDSLPVDPWGRDFLYSEEQWGRTKGHFTLTSLGKSGVPGGEGDEADVSSKYLRYLQHLSGIAGRN